jgi:ribosomal protein L22
VLVQPRELNTRLRNKMEKENKNKEKKEEKPVEEKTGIRQEISKAKEKIQEKKEAKTVKEESKEKPKEKKPEVKKPKKTEAVVNAKNLPISTKDSAAICRFIKNKKIGDAIAELEQVLRLKKAVPMRGEIPHKKGKRMMSGRFPKNAARNFIKLLKSLSANATYNSLEEPVIAEAVANIGARPYGKSGWVRKKRTYVKLKAVEVKKEK